MTWVETLRAANEAVKVYHTIEKSLATLEDNFKLIRTEATSLRTEVIQLEGRVSKLEEGRSTIAAEVRAVMAEGLADVKIAKAQIESELRVAFTKEVADLFRKDVERQRNLEKQLTGAEAPLHSSPPETMQE